MKRYAFCPVCGSPLDRSAGGATAVSRLFCGSCTFEFWQNSKPAVGAIILRNNGGKPHVLLARRGIEPYKGMWDLPGGFLNNGEHPEEGLKRELREELGTSPLRSRFLTAEIEEYPREDVAEEARFVLSLFYLCEIPGAAALTPMDDVVDVAWFPLEELPDGIAFSANHRAFAALGKERAVSFQDSAPSG